MLIDGEEWDLTGLPRHMLRDIPATVTVSVTQVRTVIATDAAHLRAGMTTYRGPVEQDFDVVLERDGVELSMADSAEAWTRGERGDWRWGTSRAPHPDDLLFDAATGKYSKPMRVDHPETIDGECDEVDE